MNDYDWYPIFDKHRSDVTLPVSTSIIHLYGTAWFNYFWQKKFYCT